MMLRRGIGACLISRPKYDKIVCIMERTREIMTPGQAAEYLQVNRETIYRYIRAGRLVASKLGNAYRIPRRSLELLLWTTRTAPRVRLREYTLEEVADFIRADQLDKEARDIAKRFLEHPERRTSRRVVPPKEPAPPTA